MVRGFSHTHRYTEEKRCRKRLNVNFAPTLCVIDDWTVFYTHSDRSVRMIKLCFFLSSVM